MCIRDSAYPRCGIDEELKVGSVAEMLRAGDDCVCAAPPFFNAAAAPVAETDEAPWPEAEIDAARNATTMNELRERSAGMGVELNCENCSSLPW